MFTPQTIPASPAVLMCRSPKKEFLCTVLILGIVLPIAPSSFPGLPIFLPRCDFSQTLWLGFMSPSSRVGH
jgi:hypothetical protein